MTFACTDCVLTCQGAPAGGKELVEVDGFTFIRKREAVQPMAPQPSPKRACAVVSPQHTAAEQGLLHPAAEEEVKGSVGSVASGIDSVASTPVGTARRLSMLPPTPQPAAAGTPPPQQQVESDGEPLPGQAEEQEGEAVQPLDESIRHQLAECLPASCPTALKLQFAASRLMAEGAARLTSSQQASLALPQPLLRLACFRLVVVQVEDMKTQSSLMRVNTRLCM